MLPQKKISILTLHDVPNYGSVLQTFATQEIFKGMGLNTNIIDYRRISSASLWQRICMVTQDDGLIKKIIKSFLYFFYLRRQDRVFGKFRRDYLFLGSVLNCEEDFNNLPIDADIYCTGSDQTWNPFVANSPEAFFLPFVENKSKKGSYGPSLAVKSLSDEKEKEYRKKLSNFSFLSCREQDGAQLLSRITQKEVKCVLDPTLLLSAKEWGKYCEFEIPKEPYILVYFLGEKSEHRRAVEKIQKLTNWKIISLPAAYLEMENNDYKKVWGGPKEFLSLIRGAALICTDSFHGTMFSINFQRNFFSFCKSSDSEESSENSRLYSALNIFGLSNRIIHNMDNLTAEDISIDYKNVIPILEEQRRDSIEYLENMLFEMTKG